MCFRLNNYFIIIKVCSPNKLVHTNENQKNNYYNKNNETQMKIKHVPSVNGIGKFNGFSASRLLPKYGRLTLELKWFKLNEWMYILIQLIYLQLVVDARWS